MVCDLEQDYIYIYKGDDTNWNNEQFVTFNVSPATGAQIDLADMTAEFILGSYTQKNISLETGTFEIDLNAATSGSFAYGPIYGIIKIYDTDKRVKTVANKIPFYFTDNVIAAQNQTRTIEVPAGSEVTIDLTVGGSVSYNNLTDLPTLNGVTIQGNGTYATYNLPTKAEVQANTQAIAEEVQNRQNGDTALQRNIDNEATARTNADNVLQGTINTKQDKLSQAQLASTNSGITSAKVSTYDAHVANKNNPHEVTKAQVGLGNVDNTADADKPISTATQSALNAKQNTLTTAQQAAVDSGVTSATVSQVQINKEDIATITEELDDNKPWQKPSDWIDIRSGALPNSVYYLVGHSADYTTYPTFAVYVEVASSGTYDVYVDGVKKASAVASGTLTTLTWQTLALETGYDVTYPVSLRTHIVRVTPTDSTKNISRIGGNGTSTTDRAGLLWVHFTTNNYLQIRYVGQSAPLLEAVTCNGDSLKISNGYSAFQGATSLKEIPTLDGNNASFSLYSMCQGNESLKQIKLKNLTSSSGVYTFNNCTSLKHIYCDNALLTFANNTFNNCESLEELPPLDVTLSTTGQTLIKGCVSLNNTFLDVQQSTGLTRLDVSGTSSTRVDGLKGLLVSNEAPFTGSSPQLNVSYTGMDRAALVNLFNSLPTVSASQVCNVTGATGADNLTASDLAIATAKGWTITR